MEESMTTVSRPFTISVLIAFAAMALLALSFLPSSAAAQEKTVSEKMVGTWTMVSNISTSADGKKSDTFGPNARGLLIFTNYGRYSWNTVSKLPKFASNNQNTGTADENKAAVRGSVAHFGTYLVNDVDKSFTVTVEGSAYPNSSGTSLKQMVAVWADEMTITSVALDGGTVEIKWKKVPAIDPLLGVGAGPG
jgi:lipocalin-like protein